MGKRIIALIVLAFGGVVSSADAGFILTSQFTLTTPGNHHNLTRSASNWYIASAVSNHFKVYDLNFNPQGQVTVSGFGDFRGLSYDSNSGNLFAGDFANSIVREVTTAGTMISQFSSLNQLNAIVYDARDNTLWLAYYTGLIEHRSRNGATVLSSFTPAGENWTGLALDTVSNTLLVLEDDDYVREYTLAGALVGTPLPADQLANNGQDIHYDSSIGRMWATSQEGNLTIFDDPARVPEPGAVAGMLAGGIAVLTVRRRGRFSHR